MLKPIVKLELHNAAVQKHIDGKKKRVLFKQGAYLKTTISRSMRYSDKPSKPGKPPHAHRKSGAHLRKGIRFNVDLATESVVCGPDLKADSKVLSSKPLPQLLNEGGVTEGIGGERVRVGPRPFLQPIFTDGGDNFRRLIETERL
jgi:hypothetical protein